MTDQEKFVAKMRPVVNAILVCGGVLFSLIWLYFIYYYIWTGQREFTSAVGIALYIVSPALLAAAFFASLRLKLVYKANLAIFCFAFTVSIYSADLLLFG